MIEVVMERDEEMRSLLYGLFEWASVAVSAARRTDGLANLETEEEMMWRTP